MVLGNDPSLSVENIHVNLQILLKVEIEKQLEVVLRESICHDVALLWQ